MVLLLPQPLLVAVRRGALLSVLAVSGFAAGAPAAGAGRGVSGDLARSDAGTGDRNSDGVELVDDRRPDPLQAGRSGTRGLPGGHGAPAGGTGLAGAGAAENSGPGRRPGGRHLRLDRSGVAPGPGGGGLDPGGAIPDIAGLHAGRGPDRAEAVGHLACLP